MDHPTALAQQAERVIHDLTVLTRPAITTLTVGDLYTITGALAGLTAALPQTLTQLSRYVSTPADSATPYRTCLTLAEATAAASLLAAALEAAHQALGDTAETHQTNPRGSTFNRR